ncbi:MAG: GNAT family N-acetyltransferase [Polyangia bacterium]
MFTIRRATPADAVLLSALSRETFVETFGHLYARADLHTFLDETYAPSELARLLSNPELACWLAYDLDVAVGHALAGPCSLPHEDVRPDHGEVKRLYLVAAAQNRGWGGLLLDAALAWLEREGPCTLWLGVYSENFGAQRFYNRRGFDTVGAYLFPVGAARDRELIMRRTAAT